MCSFLIEERYYEKFRRYKEAQKKSIKVPTSLSRNYIYACINICMQCIICNIIYYNTYLFVFHKFDILHKTIYTFIFYIIANRNTFYVKISCCIIFSIPLFLIFCHPIIDLLFVRYLSASHFFRKCT